MQGPKVLADNPQTYKENVELLELDNLNISYSMRDSGQQYEGEIYYKVNEKQNDKALKLKFSIYSEQKVSVSSENNWEIQESNSIISNFMLDDEGLVILRADHSIEKLNLAIQVDSKIIENGQELINENILEGNVDQIYSLYIPKNQETEVKKAASLAETTEESSSNKEDKEISKQNNESNLSFSYPSNFGIKSLFDEKAQNYENISPKYTEDETGIYPSQSWMPENNTKVINHQGWNAFSSNWDGIDSWDGNPANLTNSYIEHAGTNNPVDFALRKYARETETPGLYDVFLNVRGNVQNPIKPVDIVLVVDMSGSMEGAREGAIKQGVKSFLSSIENTAYAQYVNVGLVGYSSPGYISNSGYITVPMESLATDGHVSAMNKALERQFVGGTFTQLGIRQGAQMLKEDASGNEKMIILMTDGVPTFSNKVSSAQLEGGVLYGTDFDSNSLDEPSFTSQLWMMNGNNRTPAPYTVSGETINDTWAATLGEAKIAKDDGAEIHTLGIQLGKDSGYTNDSSNTYLSQEEVRKRTSLIASSGLYQDADSAENITDYLKNQADVVLSRFNTITNGSIIDPLGTQFNYSNSEVSLTSVGEGLIENLPNFQINNRTLEVSNLNIGRDQEIQIHYQVHLDTESDDFKTDYWYQINGETTLTPNGSNPTNKVNFGVPSAKLPGVNLTFEKQWLANIENMPTEVDLVIGRKTGQNLSDWSKTVTIKQENGKWLTYLENLPKFSKLGEEFTYEIKDEITQNNDIYHWISSSEDKNTIVNVERFQLQLVKTSSHENKPLSGVQFVLKNSQDQEVGAGRTNEQGELLFDDLRLKYDESYSLHEVPISGHLPAGPWEIKTKIIDGQPALTVDGKAYDLDDQFNRFMISLSIRNDIDVEKFKNSIIIDKRASDSEEKLSDAVFNLYQLSSIDDDLTQLSPLESMTNLLPGLYAIQEHISPNGYYKDNELHFFQVKFDGTIVALDSEAKEIPFLDENEEGKNGFILENGQDKELHLTLVFYNSPAPPLYLEVEKVDDDFTSPLSGVTFELTRLGRATENEESVDEKENLNSIVKFFDKNITNETIALQSNSDGKLTLLDAGGNIQENAAPISLDYDSKYQLVKKNSIGLFPDFGETSQWTITTPNMDDIQEHEEDNNIQIKGEDLLITPDESIRETIIQTPTALGIVSLIKTHNPEFKSLESLESQAKRTRIPTLSEETSAYVISFEIRSNVTHSFTIEKVDGADNQPLDTQFSLRWVEKFETSQDFATLESLDLNSLELSGNDISSSLSNVPIDVRVGATLSTEKGSKTLEHMGRGNLYIISEENTPEGYQKTNTVIVAYMDKEQAYADKAAIHIRLARRSVTNPELLEFGNLEDFKEYKGGLDNKLGIVFANYKTNDIEDVEDAEAEKEVTDNSLEDKEEKDKSNSNSKLPALGATAIGGIGLTIVLLGYLMKRFLGKK